VPGPGQTPTTPSTPWRLLGATERNQIWVRTQGPFLETIARGWLDLEPSQGIGAVGDRLIREFGFCDGFHDWWDVTGYDHAVRSWWEGWLQTVPRGGIRGATFLVRSRIVSMGLTLANLKYRDISFRACRDRAVYDGMRDEKMIGSRPPAPPQRPA